MAQVNKSASSSKSKATSPPHTPTRSRSNSIMKGSMDSPSTHQPQQQQQQAHSQPQPQPQPIKRSTTNDLLLSRLPSLHHHSHHDSLSPSAQAQLQLSEAQLSNKPEDYELKEPIGKYTHIHIHNCYADTHHSPFYYYRIWLIGCRLWCCLQTNQ